MNWTRAGTAKKKIYDRDIVDFVPTGDTASAIEEACAQDKVLIYSCRLDLYAYALAIW